MRRLLLILCLLAALPFVALAQASSPAETTRDLDRIEQQLEDPRLNDADFDRLRKALESLREAVTKLRAEQREEAAGAQGLLDALGPAPAAGQPRESQPVADQRRQLTQRNQAAQDAVKQAELALVRIAGLQEKLGAESRQQFTRKLAYRGTAPVSPDFWSNAFADLPSAWTEAMLGLQTQELPGRTTLIQTVFVVGAVLLFGIPLLTFLRRRRGIAEHVLAPGPEQRSVAALIEWLRRAALPVAALWAAYAVLNANGWLESGSFGILVASIGFSLSLALLGNGLADAALAPKHPAWAMVALPQPERDRLLRRVRLLSLIVLIGGPLAAMLSGPYAGRAGRDFVTSLSALYFILFAVSVADLRLWRPLSADWRGLNTGWYALMIASVVVLLALLLGYFSIGRFLAAGVFLSMLVSGTYLLLRLGLRDAMRIPPRAPEAGSEPDENDMTEAVNRLGSTGRFLAGLLIDMALMLALIAALFLAWGMGTATLGAYGLQLIYGVSIGSVTLSLLDVLAAVVIVGLGVAATRFVSSGLNLRLEGQTQIDAGVRNSIVTGISYVGYVLSGILAVATLGLNLSNLAIIAGALSVGIGFGLQNIVNNFVSGLILLIERPVKVGDWVVVGGKEGYVRRINVRSTEIETFPRASVIIPNSELISSAVMNWTHRDKFGRVDLDIGVAYGSDIDKVEQVLLDCLKGHREILAYPPPYIVLRGFAETALNFSLRGHIANVERRATVESEIRKAIYKAFMANEIILPNRQLDPNLTEITRIKAALQIMRMADEEAAKAAQKPEQAEPEKKA